MIEFGYFLHSFIIDSDITKENEWFDYVFSLHVKIVENDENFTILDFYDIEKLLMWLDWICQIIVASEGFHNDNFFVKQFLSQSDDVFKQFKKFKSKNKIEQQKSSN